MSPLYKRLRVNTAILYIQSGGNRLLVRISIKTNFHSQRNKLWPLISRSTRIWSNFTSRASTLKMFVALEEGNLPGQMWLVTSVARRSIYRNNKGKREIDLVGNHPRSTKTIFQNGSLISLFFQITKTWQHPPWTTTTRITTGVPIKIMKMVHGDFTGRMATMSVKRSKAINNMFVLPIPLPMQ